MPIMPIVVMAHVSPRIVIFNHSDDSYSGGLGEDLAMKMTSSGEQVGFLKKGS
jgi:hypothetical protein